jgi:hypothetical protein
MSGLTVIRPKLKAPVEMAIVALANSQEVGLKMHGQKKRRKRTLWIRV